MQLPFMRPHEQTEALCLEAVEEDGHELEYVYQQTEAICIAAVKSEWKALRYVKQQTLPICQAAIEHNGDALDYTDLPMNDLLNPNSGQLQDWLTLLRACRNTDVHSVDNTIHPLIDAIPFGDAYSERWCQHADAERTMLDLLEALAGEMVRLAPDCDKVSGLCQQVQQQGERILRRAWQRAQADANRDDRRQDRDVL